MTDPRAHWNKRYDNNELADAPVAPFLPSVARHLPAEGAALDIGGGLGRNARWLAARGLDVTLLDVSDVGLSRAAELDTDPESRIEYLQRDVEADGLPPDRTWDLALMHLFFVQDLVGPLTGQIEPGGVVLICQPTITNLERHERPGRRHLLEVGEIRRIAEGLEGMEVLEVSEAWRESGRHDAWLVARRT